MKIARKAIVGFTLAAVLATASISSASIIYPKEPEGGRQVVSENATRTLKRDPGFYDNLKIEDLTISAPHRCYYVGLTNISSGQLVSAAKPGSWRYLLLHRTNGVGEASVIADDKTGELRFNGLNRPFFPDATLEALRKAENLRQIKQHDYELRYLDIASMAFIAVWLHSESGDIIIPLPPTFGRVDAYEPCTESQIIKILKPEAEKKLKRPPAFD